jgi:Matrixin
MNDRLVSAREATRVRRNRAARPVLEGLEQRLLMYAATGDHFAFSSRITWSIMPDGTSIGGGVSSNLVSTLNSELGSGKWLQPLEDAFAQWSSVANVNAVQVGDDGQPFGSGNYQQGNPNEGDVRIGGFSQNSGVMAFTLLPPKNNGGSDAGDMFFNTSQSFHINSDYDFETVAVHEIGHAVAGLGESSNPSAAEYEYYNGIKQGLATDDVNGIQALWGPRAEDATEQATHDTTWQNAAVLTGSINSQNQVILPTLDVANSSESYWFKVTTPSNAFNQFTAQVQSSNLSELSPRVSIFNSSLQSLTQTIAPTNAYGDTIAATVYSATPNTTYYVRVLGSNSGVTGVGSYGLTIDMGSQPIVAIPAPNTYVAAQADQGGGGEFEMTQQASLWTLLELNQVEQGLLNLMGSPTSNSSQSNFVSSVLLPTIPTNSLAANELLDLALSSLWPVSNASSTQISQTAYANELSSGTLSSNAPASSGTSSSTWLSILIDVSKTAGFLGD